MEKIIEKEQKTKKNKKNMVKTPKKSSGKNPKKSDKKKRRTLLHKGSKTQKVLTLLAKALEDGAFLLDEFLDVLVDPRRRYMTGRRNTKPMFQGKRSVSEARATVKKLAKRGYIEIKEGGMLALTEKADLEIARDRIAKKQNPHEWDGKWRLFIFDVAEEKRTQRDFLRRRLKEWKFVELQQSVWVTPYDVREEIEQFVELSNIFLRGDIRFAEVENLSKDDDLKDHFKL